MTTSNLTFNMLTFNHPSEEYTFYFYKDKSDNLQRIHKTLVPEEVIEEFGKQEHYYTFRDSTIPILDEHRASIDLQFP